MYAKLSQKMKIVVLGSNVAEHFKALYTGSRGHGFKFGR